MKVDHLVMNGDEDTQENREIIKDIQAIGLPYESK